MNERTIIAGMTLSQAISLAGLIIVFITIWIHLELLRDENSGNTRAI